MLGLVDYHTHTVLSDGANTHEEMVRVAIEKGLDEIGFSDHVCLKPVEWAIDVIDIPVMGRLISDLKAKYKDLIKIRYGIELDYFPGRENELRDLISGIPLDYVIGSVHFIGDWNFDTDKSLYGKWSNDQLYEMYFDIIQMAASSRLFDIIGHLDIIKKFRVYPESDQEKLFDEVLQTIHKNDLVVELNTGGVDRPCAEFTPSPQIIELCRQKDIPVTLSSDAHHASQIARHYETAVDLLTGVGYHEIAGFENRKRKMIRL